LPGQRIWWCCAMVLAARLEAQDLGRPPVRTDDERGRLDLAVGDEMRVSLGGYLQVDGRWGSGPQTRAPDGLLLRRARLVFDAAHPRGWHVRLQPDFGQGRVQVQDAFVGWRGRRLTARLGRFRPAFGTERMQSSSTLLFAERSIVNTLMPSRSMGGQLSVQGGAFNVTAGAFRTPLRTDAPLVDTDGDVSATSGVGYDLLARTAWRRARGASYADVQASVLAGEERGTPEIPAVARLLSVGQLPLVVFRNDGTRDGTVVADGRRGRASVGSVVGTARLMVGAEAAQHWQQVRLASAGRMVRSTALSLRSAMVFNGVRDVNQEITPYRAGAIEVGVRGGLLELTDDSTARLQTGGSARDVRAAGVAIGWIPTVTTRLSAALDVTTPTFGGRREHVAVMRWQQAF
jgi:phosphate-selective porin OprO and OprP